MEGKDKRLLLILGPCSVHDMDAVYDYATKISTLQKKIPEVYMVMRMYFEKPRTRKGWSGFLSDPALDGRMHLDRGILCARELLLKINALGLPCATEMLSVIFPQYIDDLISAVAIGARTSASQVHRELASGLSAPVFFKNDCSGSFTTAINSAVSASEPKVFLGVDADGKASAVHTQGNPTCYVMLRGSYTSGPNYTKEHLDRVQVALKKEEGMETHGIVVDCNHGNSGKDALRQLDVAKYLRGLRHPIVRGIMLESFLEFGRQDTPVVYGQSITDPCLSWEHTKACLMDLKKIDIYNITVDD